MLGFAVPMGLHHLFESYLFPIHVDNMSNTDDVLLLAELKWVGISVAAPGVRRIL